MGEFFVLAFVVSVNGTRDSSGHNRKCWKEINKPHVGFAFPGLDANILCLHGLLLIISTCRVLSLLLTSVMFLLPIKYSTAVILPVL